MIVLFAQTQKLISLNKYQRYMQILLIMYQLNKIISFIIIILLNININIIMTETEVFLKENSIQISNLSPYPQLLKKFTDLPEFKRFSKILQDNQWKQPTIIQKISIPIILKDRNLIAVSRTGSGKTLSYIIPLCIYLKRCNTNALIIVPTRQLALQVVDEFLKFEKDVGCVYGGIPKYMQKQELYKRVLVATPGRMVDFLQNWKYFPDFDFLVIDQVDCLLQLGFQEQLEKIIKKISYLQHIYMFTATFTKNIQRIASKYIEDPVILTVGGKNTTNSNIKQYFMKFDKQQDKFHQLIESLNYYNKSKCLVFVNTKRKTQYLYEKLKKKIDNSRRIQFFHGGLQQQSRNRIMKQFRSRYPNILISTDVSSRGLDVSDIQVIINYQFPNNIHSYTHRIGRTARYNRKGYSLTFVMYEPQFLLRQLIQYLLKSRVQVEEWLLDYANYQIKRYKELQQSILDLDENVSIVKKKYKLKQEVSSQLEFKKIQLSTTDNTSFDNPLHQSLVNQSFAKKKQISKIFNQTKEEQFFNLSFKKRAVLEQSFVVQQNSFEKKEKKKVQPFDLKLYKPKKIEFQINFSPQKQICLCYSSFKTEQATVLVIQLENPQIKKIYQGRKTNPAMKYQNSFNKKGYVEIRQYQMHYSSIILIDQKKIKKQMIWMPIFKQLIDQQIQTVVISPSYMLLYSTKQEILKQANMTLDELFKRFGQAPDLKKLKIVIDNEKIFKVFSEKFFKKFLL